MKFPQLSNGQRFEHQGRVYVKVSPLIACDVSSNERRFFARSAEVTIAGEDGPAPEKSAACPLDAEAVFAALNDYHARCQRCVEDLAQDPAPDAIATARGRLEQARRQFLRQLQLPVLE